VSLSKIDTFSQNSRHASGSYAKPRWGLGYVRQEPDIPRRRARMGMVIDGY
jgi:hypothetical protein